MTVTDSTREGGASQTDHTQYSCHCCGSKLWSLTHWILLSCMSPLPVHHALMQRRSCKNVQYIRLTLIKASLQFNEHFTRFHISFNFLRVADFIGFTISCWIWTKCHANLKIKSIGFYLQSNLSCLSHLEKFLLTAQWSISISLDSTLPLTTVDSRLHELLVLGKAEPNM